MTFDEFRTMLKFWASASCIRLGAFLGQPLQLKARKELFILAPCAGIFVLSPKLGILPRNLASTTAHALDFLGMWMSGVGQDLSSLHSTGGWLANRILKELPYVHGCRDNLIFS